MEKELRINPDDWDAFAQAELTTLEAWLKVTPDVDLHKPGLPEWRKRGCVVRDGVRWYYKLFVNPPRDYWPLDFASPAHYEHSRFELMHHAGVPVPRVLAWGGGEKKSVIVLAEAAGQSLESWVPEHAHVLKEDEAMRRQLIKAVAEVTRTMHGGGLVHRDYYLAHLFLDAENEKRYQTPFMGVSVIDLQRVKPMGALKWRWVMKDLAALDYSSPQDIFSLEDRLYFMQCYCNKKTLGFADKLLMQAVQLKVKQIARHDQRRLARLETAQSDASESA